MSSQQPTFWRLEEWEPCCWERDLYARPQQLLHPPFLLLSPPTQAYSGPPALRSPSDAQVWWTSHDTEATYFICLNLLCGTGFASSLLSSPGVWLYSFPAISNHSYSFSSHRLPSNLRFFLQNLFKRWLIKVKRNSGKRVERSFGFPSL